MSCAARARSRIPSCSGSPVVSRSPGSTRSASAAQRVDVEYHAFLGEGIQPCAANVRLGHMHRRAVDEGRGEQFGGDDAEPVRRYDRQAPTARWSSSTITICGQPAVACPSLVVIERIDAEVWIVGEQPGGYLGILVRQRRECCRRPPRFRWPGSRGHESRRAAVVLRPAPRAGSRNR